MKQLERLLFLQGNRCFFCLGSIPVSERSVEHLVATSNGGSNDDENCVACCKAINAALGKLSIKAKFEVILKHRGTFECPRQTATKPETLAPVLPVPAVSPSPPLSAPPLQVPPVSNDVLLAEVVAGLQKQGSSRPKRVKALKHAIKSFCKSKPSKAAIESVVAEMQAKAYISVQNTSVVYSLPTQT